METGDVLSMASCEFCEWRQGLRCCFLASTRSEHGVRSRNARPGEPAKMPPNSPDEAVRPAASLAGAATFLDSVALDWTRQRKCGTCHTNYPYMVARPVLKEPASAAMAEIRGFFEKRVAHWDDADKDAKPRWDAEVVSTAAALAMNDAATSGKLHPLSRQALDRVWTVQKPDGGFDWLKCGWPPLEHDDYYGAIVAALGVGHAPDGYAGTPVARCGCEASTSLFLQESGPEFPSSGHAALGVHAGRGVDDRRRAKRHDCAPPRSSSVPTEGGIFPR